MAEDARTPAWRGVVATFLLTLVAGVIGGVATIAITQKRPRLTYDVTTNQTFSGQLERMGIMSVRVANEGAKEVEDVVCRLRVADVHIVDYKVDSLPPGSMVSRPESTLITAAIPFVNPHEEVTLSVLYTPPSGRAVAPDIEVRGKGLSALRAASPRDAATGARPGDPRPDLLVLATAMVAALSASTGMLSKYFSSRHSDDQRDVTAYVLGLHGFATEATSVRQSGRPQSYWSISDYFTEQILRSGDPAMCGRAQTALDNLLEYASMASPSRALVHLNCARLALAAGDRIDAVWHVGQAERLGRRLVTARLKHLPELARATAT